MQVKFYNISSNNQHQSFGSMKKSQFHGIDLSVVEKYKAPIEKFNEFEELQIWAKRFVQNIKSKNFLGRQKETLIQRNNILKEWFDYFNSNDKKFLASTQFLILAGITKNLKENNDTLPPVLNESILHDSVDELNKKLAIDPKLNFDFNKIYQTNFKNSLLTNSKGYKWIELPSKTSDSKNFSSNIEKLQALSSKSWCTKSFVAEPYLKNGDIHILLENDIPKVCIRLYQNDIIEIQGELNNSQVPLSYLDKVCQYIKANNLTIEKSTQAELDKAIDKKHYVDQVINDLKGSIKNKQYDKILNYFGINTKINEDGSFILSNYLLPSKCLYSDLGIDENDMFKNVVKIDGNANFSRSELVNLGRLQEIDGDAYFSFSNIVDLKNLRKIGGNVNFANSYIKSLGKLELIAGSANFGFSKVENLGNLTFIGGDANFRGSTIPRLGNLKTILGNAIFTNSKISKFDNLEKVGGKVITNNSLLDNKQLGRLSG